MHHEASLFTMAVRSISKMISIWEKEIREYGELIDTRKEANENVGGMEISLRKQTQRYNELITFAETSIAYVRELEKKIEANEDRKAAAQLKSLQKRIRDIERRCGIPMHEW